MTRTRLDAIVDELFEREPSPSPIDPAPSNYPGPLRGEFPRGTVTWRTGAAVAYDVSVTIESPYDEHARRHGIMITLGPPKVVASFKLYGMRGELRELRGGEVFVTAERGELMVRFALQVVEVARPNPGVVVVGGVGTLVED